MAVQLIRMEDTPSPATCMTSSADKSLAAVGLSSGQMLFLTVNSQAQVVPLAESGSIAATSDTVSRDKLDEDVSSSDADLAIITLTEQHEAAVTTAQLSTDCRNLATISSDGAVFVWDTFAGSDADLYVASRTVIAGASCAAWLPGRRLLIGTSTHQLVVSPYTSDQHCCIITAVIIYFHTYLVQNLRIHRTEDLSTDGVLITCILFHVASFAI